MGCAFCPNSEIVPDKPTLDIKINSGSSSDED